MPKRPKRGAETIAGLPPAALRKACVDAVRDPWCASFTTSARSSAPLARSAASAPASMSPGNSTVLPATETRSTNDASLRERAVHVSAHRDSKLRSWQVPISSIPSSRTEMRQEAPRTDLELRDIAEVWRRGSVIASWLLDLTATALTADPALAKFGGRVSDSGEGRWTIKAAIDEAVPVPVLTAALYECFSSHGEAEFQNKVLSAMRFAFGGHHEKAAGK